MALVETPAEEFDYLLNAGTEGFLEPFFALMQFMSQGGRTPGLTVPSKEELRALYESASARYWQQLKATDPSEAQSQIKEWKAAGGE